MPMVCYRIAINHPLHQIALLADLRRQEVLLLLFEVLDPLLIHAQDLSSIDRVEEQYGNNLLAHGYTILATRTMFRRPAVWDHQCPSFHPREFRIEGNFHRLIVAFE